MAYDLSSADEVKEYIENLGIEYRFSCYHEKRPDGCQLLGDYLEAIKKDFARAAKVYGDNCDDHRHGKSCYKYASYNYLGKGINKSEEKAFEYFVKGCKYNYGQACLFSGLILTSQKSNLGKKDYLQGLSYFDKGCNGDNQESCFHASGFYLKGNQYIQKDTKKAFHYTEKGCALGHLHSCANLSMMYDKGEGVVENKELAKKYKDLVLEVQNQMQKEKGIKFGETQ